jgi:broad specificity phosphatase PhoE
MPYELDERWVELDYGALDGVPIAEVDADVWARWRVDPTYRAGGGESMEAMSKRCVAAAEELIDDARHQLIVVASHVSPIKAVVAWVLGVDVTVGWAMHLDQASVTRILCGPAGPVLLGYNETRRTQTSWRPIP